MLINDFSHPSVGRYQITNQNLLKYKIANPSKRTAYNDVAADGTEMLSRVTDPGKIEFTISQDSELNTLLKDCDKYYMSKLIITTDEKDLFIIAGNSQQRKDGTVFWTLTF